MNKYMLAALSVIAGIISGLAWTSWCSGLVLLISFVPFFLIENYLFENPKKYSPNDFFIYILPGFVIFSMITMGWMRVASLTGAICVIMGLSFLMSFVTWLAHIVRLHSGNTMGIITMITFWLTYEYASLNISIVSPWINLGNGLSKDILFIQWYDLTGTGGGSLWILCSNIFLTLFLVTSLNKKNKRYLYLIIWVIILVIPAVFSIYRYNNIVQNNKNGSEVVIVQPNTDPYTEKFTLPFDVQIKNVIELTGSEITDNTEWLITPETTIDDPANLDDLMNDKYVRKFQEELTKHHSHLNIITGLVTYRLYPLMKEPPTMSARKIDASGLFYDHFNSAVQIDSGNTFGVYHKSKLVPGIEMQFSSGPGRFLTRILPYLGGTKWGYGMQSDRVVFTHTTAGIKIAPVICYESVFGSFVTDYVKKGAQAIFIITNDGWWKNTNGYAQHLSFASLRAIETRRQIARSANTGVSCIIDIRGNRKIETEWWHKTAIRGEIFPETRLTPYVKYGDLIPGVAAIISAIFFFIIFIALPIRKKISY
jgi:apolipoprotein N-acyltransferase